MAERHGEDSIAPRRSLGGPILPPPPPELAEEAARKEEKEAARVAKEEERARKAAERKAQKEAQKQAEKKAATAKKAPAAKAAAKKPATAAKKSARPARQKAAPAPEPEPTTRAMPAAVEPAPAQPVPAAVPPAAQMPTAAAAVAVQPVVPGIRRRRARLRIVQVDAWSVMKTAFLLSIALGIVLVVAVAVIWSVLGSAGVWDSINSTVQQAVGSDNGSAFDIEDYLGTSRVVGFAMVVAVLNVILLTAIATLAAFLYNLAAALLGGVEVTLAERK